MGFKESEALMRFPKIKNGLGAWPHGSEWSSGLLNLAVTKWMAFHVCTHQKRCWSVRGIEKLSQGGKPELSPGDSVLWQANNYCLQFSCQICLHGWHQHMYPSEPDVTKVQIILTNMGLCSIRILISLWYTSVYSVTINSSLGPSRIGVRYYSFVSTFLGSNWAVLIVNIMFSSEQMKWTDFVKTNMSLCIKLQGYFFFKLAYWFSGLCFRLL